MNEETCTREEARCSRWNLTPSVEVDPRVQVRLLSGPSNDPSRYLVHITVRFPLDAYPITLVSDLDAAGWSAPDISDLDLHPAGQPGQPSSAWDTPLPYPTGELVLTWHTGDPQHEWTRDIRNTRVEAARTVLRSYGITRSPICEETWHDLV